MPFSLNLKKSTKFLICNLAFIVGLVLGFWLKINIFALYLIILTNAVLVVVFYQKTIKITLLITCFFCLGWWRQQIFANQKADTNIEQYNNQKIKFTGIVSAEPERRQSQTKITVQSQKIIPNNQKVSGQVLITAKLFPEFTYGDELLIDCELQQPIAFSGFAYDKYLARYNIYSTCYYPQITLLNKNQGHWFYKNIYNFKNKTKQITEQSLAEPHSALISAILLGDKRDLSQEWLDKFTNIGISHIIAISGMNISVLVLILFYCLIILGITKNQAFYLSTIFITLYLIIIGFPASGVRAGVMVGLILLSLKIGRLNKEINTLLFTATLMLAINPFLVYDVGFYLSFLAIIALMYIFPWLDNKTYKLPNLWGIKKIILATIAVQLTTLPLILYFFGSFSFISIIANLFIAPLNLLLMLGGFIMIIFGFLWLNLAKIIGIIIWLITSYFFILTEFFNNLITP